MKLKDKIYYHLSESLYLNRNTALTSERLYQKKLFLYFDYEREFSGFQTNISNEDVFELIDTLEKYQFKGTWFTVGKVVEKYFPTIEYLIKKGHEVGSHTFSHISPNEITEKELLEDLASYEETKKKFNLDIKGFHSPKDRWNLKMFDHLFSRGYQYDIFPPKQKKSILGGKYQFFKGNKIHRLITLGDDWVLYDQKKRRTEVFDYFKSLYQQIIPGEIRGIGAHPWVLYSDNNILEGYTDFLQFLSMQEDLHIDKAINFIKEVQLEEKSQKKKSHYSSKY